MVWPLSVVRIAVRGGGDMGSGVAYRLHRAGFSVLILERPQPLMVRRTVSFGTAVLDGEVTVEGVTARLVDDLDEAAACFLNGIIPVMVDPEGLHLTAFDPLVVVDARMRKADPGQQPFRAPLLIGLGPGFEVPANCDAAIETSRGHHLGRIIYEGATRPHSHQPGDVLGHREDRVLRAPLDGTVTTLAEIGDDLALGQPIARVGDQQIDAPFDGVLRGLIADGTPVTKGLKIGDIDPRRERAYAFTISEKSFAIGGGVLEAVLASPYVRQAVEGVRS